MDRKLQDDIYCFTEILNKYFLIQISNLDKKISEYQFCIESNNMKKLDTSITSGMVLAIDYSTGNNQKRIEFANAIKKELLEELNRIQNISNKYYVKNNIMANSYIEHYYKFHKEILENLIRLDFV